MAKLTTEQLIEAFKELTLIELSDFVKAFEEAFDVTAAAPVAVAAAGPAAVVEEVEEKDTFDVILTVVGEKKIQVIKEVRALTSLGLGEAKALVDEAPKPVLEGVKKEEAAKAKEVLEAAGATVEVKYHLSSPPTRAGPPQGGPALVAFWRAACHGTCETGGTPRRCGSVPRSARLLDGCQPKGLSCGDIVA